MLSNVLILTPIGPTAASYYFAGQGPGRWVGAGIGALELQGIVQQRELSALLRGCDPRDRRFLPARKPARRRSGWDFTLAAPKSVSLVAALADDVRDSVVMAHRAAVDEVLGDFERRLLRLKRAGGPEGVMASQGAVAAAFEHSRNASGEPHLHTHLLVMNLGRDPDGAWSAIDGRWWPARHSIAALYQLGLRHQLRAADLALDWRTRTDGLADLADVPRAAIRSTSTRGRRALADQRANTEPGTRRRSAIRAGATLQTRHLAGPEPWEGHAQQHGFGRAEAARLVDAARAAAQVGRRDDHPARIHGVSLTETVTSHLAAQRSSFRLSDVLVALAWGAPAGMAPLAAVAWADQFCANAVPVPVGATAAPRWTTRFAVGADLRLVESITGWHRPRRRQPEPAVAALSLPQRQTLSPEGLLAVHRLLETEEPVHVLAAPPGRSNLLAHAAVVEAATAAWRAQGLRVGVASFGPEDQIRWQALTGLDSRRTGHRPDVIIVDRADRRSTPNLLALTSDIQRSGAVAVLIEGGTAPRLTWTRSDGLQSLGRSPISLDPGAAPSWSPDPDALEQTSQRSTRGVASYPTAAAAARDLVARWAGEWATEHPALLVGLGFAETDALNQAARSIRVRRGEIGGPALACGGRVLQTGDRVLPLRRIDGELSRASALTVVEVDPARSEVTVIVGTRTRTLGRRDAAHLGYGYAVTPALLPLSNGPVLLLGPSDGIAGARDRTLVTSAVVVPEPPTRDRSRATETGPRLVPRHETERGLELA
jgi:conjugative relaxase-like TrwC/TraI family protein